VSLGLGVAGLAAGAVTGLMTMDRKNTVDADCPGGICRSSAGLDAASEGKTLSLVSTVAFAAGAVGVGLGVVLIVSGGSSPAKATAITSSAGPRIAQALAELGLGRRQCHPFCDGGRDRAGRQFRQ
jgi:hypothetical protein